MPLKKLISALLVIAIVFTAFAAGYSVSAAADYEAKAKKLDKTTFDGELGAIYSKSSTTFRVWAPTSSDVKVKFFESGDSEVYTKIINMKFRKSTGVWSATVKGDFKNTYYTYLIKRGKKVYETYDIYAKACAANGRRSMVVDLDSTNPKGWGEDKYVSVDNPTDAIIWEVQISDFSSSATSGVSRQNRGKYLAFTEKGTTLNAQADAPATCVDYLKELGVNYVHINPFYDFGSIDETDTSNKDSNFNWGYDPMNYNVPEGSYSTDPTKGAKRIKECKKMIQALHKAGIGVIMDVVYNHTHESKNSAFNLTVPDYYYRINADGSWSNGSGCGNDTASERKMFSKYMTDSVMYWAREYHIDGFRFDLMGLHDVGTMNKIRSQLDTLEGGEKLLMYGEAWNLNTTADSGTELANQNNMSKLNTRIAAFDDTFRDGVKGSTNGADKGYIQSGEGTGKVKTGIIAQADGTMGWAQCASQAVTYASCHDNLTLWDKLVLSEKGKDAKYDIRYNDLVEMNKLAGALTLTSQGTSFMLAGEEFCRTKNGDENSYKSGVKLNQLDWNSLHKYGDVSDYYKGLIEVRKNISAFRDPTAETAKNIKFVENAPEGVIAYTLKDEKFGTVAVAFNASDSNQSVNFDGSFVQLVNKNDAGMTKLADVGNTLSLEPKSAAVLVDKVAFNAADVKPEYGKVNVRYKCDGEVFNSYVVRGKLGEDYYITPLSDVMMNYNINKKLGVNGKFSEDMSYCTFECEKYDGVYSTVVFECLDDKSNSIIFDSTVLKNRMGQAYETPSIPSVDGYTLNLQKLPQNGCGEFSDKNIKVKYYYTKKAKDDLTCRVNIVYMSTDGKILGTDTMTGDEGTSYKTSQIEIENYEFKSVTDNAEGDYSQIEHNVLYIYSPVSIASYIGIILTIIAFVLVISALGLFYRRRRRNELMKKLDIS